MAERNLCEEAGCYPLPSCCHNITGLVISEDEVRYFENQPSVQIDYRNPLTEQGGYVVSFLGACPNLEGNNCRVRGKVATCTLVEIAGRICQRHREKDEKLPVGAITINVADIN